MSFSRIRAILLQEWYISRRSVEVVIDLPFFSVISVIVFGFVTAFLATVMDASAARYLFLGAILWEIIRVAQYSMSVEALWNVWSRNLSNMFITPLTLREYMLAQMLSGSLKALLIFAVLSLISATLFHFNLYVMGVPNLLLFFVNLVFFAWSVGLVLLGIIFRFGTRIQALAWGMVFIFQPLTAAYYPVRVLPPALQSVAKLLPPTYVFEAARGNLDNPAIRWDSSGRPSPRTSSTSPSAVLFFNFMFRRSKETGQFARNEEWEWNL